MPGLGIGVDVLVIGDVDVDRGGVERGHLILRTEFSCRLTALATSASQIDRTRLIALHLHARAACKSLRFRCRAQLLQVSTAVEQMNSSRHGTAAAT